MKQYIIPRVKRDMSVREALAILSLCFSSKRTNWPFDIKKVYMETFSRPLPSENHHGISVEQSIDYERIKEELFTAAIEFLAEKIER